MILQKLSFQNPNICEREHMYYNCENVVTLMEKEFSIFSKGSILRSDTYFNSFSIGKWKKYTKINNLKLTLILKGEFLVRICHAETMHANVKRKIISETTFTSCKADTICLPIKLEEFSGLYYFELISLSDQSEYMGGAYETDVEPDEILNVKIAIGICTFRREKYIINNLNILDSVILNNPESPLYNRLEIFVSDNGKTLPSNLNSDYIHVFPNRNLGGAGGFTRSMIEIMHDTKVKGFTHVLLMDDDVRMNPDSLERTYALLSLLKPEYKDTFIGGHMLKIDATNIQSEAADHWNIVAHHPVKYNYNLENIKYILKNEIEDSVNYLSWWYCCMPISVVNANNLPLPIFIKRDDIEYGLRNGNHFLTLNGICVWHEPFEYKNASYLEYYYFRNLCIMNSRHRLSFSEKRLQNELKLRTTRSLLRFRYKEAELGLLGVQHYLKGIDWLKTQDAEKLNGEIMKLGYKKKPLDDLDFVFAHGVYEKNLKYEEGKKKKLIRLLTLNGLLLPANKSIVVPAYQPSTALFYKAKRVLNYEEITNSGFITERDFHSLFKILKMYRDTQKMIRKNFNRITNEYRSRYDELTNLDFWNKYLFESGECDVIVSIMDKKKRPKNTKYQYKHLLKTYLLRMLQALLFWLPIKKNRVMFYVHERKGMTCNPKYIANKLIELYGDKLELIWVTMYPETCSDATDLGIKVIKRNSIEEFKYYLRTRFYITNDMFPCWALHRWNQKWMNTWHGALSYKHIGYDYIAPMSSLGDKLFRMSNRQPDFYLSGCQEFTKDTSKSFLLDEKVFLPTGLPRNDILFEDSQKYKDKIRTYYKIESDKKMVMFAPTFRRGMKSDTYGMDFELLRKTLSDKFDGEWVILFRNHTFVKNKQNYYNGVIDVSRYNDMQELLCAADVLISDYSSCMYDFCMTKKPCFVYTTDLDNYINNDRAFAVPIENWPYTISKSNEELAKHIKEFSQDTYIKRVNKHLKEVGVHDDGTASLQVAKLIEKYCIK